MDIIQNLLRQWVIAGLYQALTWTKVDFSLVMLCGIDPRAILAYAQASILYNEFDNHANKTKLNSGQKHHPTSGRLEFSLFHDFVILSNISVCN